MTVSIFGVKINCTLYYAIMAFVLYKFGFKYFAGLGVLYAISEKSDSTVASTTTDTTKVLNGQINPVFQNNANTAPVVTPAVIVSVLPVSLSPVASAGSSNLVLTINTDWTAIASDAWLSVSPASGSGNDTLAVAVLANAGVARAGSIKLYAGNVNVKTIVVSQSAVGAVSCDVSNTSPFAVSSAIYDATDHTLTFQFNASNLTAGTWSILNGSTVVGAGSIPVPTSSTIVLPNIPVLTDGSYTFQLVGGSCTGTASKTFTVSGVGTGGTGLVIYPSYGADVPVDNTANVWNVQLFPDFVCPEYFRTEIQDNAPNFMVVLHSGVDKRFYQLGASMKNKGITGSGFTLKNNGLVGLESVNREVECSEFIYFVNPNDGLPWAGGINTRCGNSNVNDFVTSLAYNKRLRFQSVTSDVSWWDNASETDLKNLGENVAFASYFGNLNVNGKYEVLYTNFDWEVGYESGTNPRKGLRFLKSAVRGVRGFVAGMYVNPILQIGYLTAGMYPDALGVFGAGLINPLFSVQTESYEGEIFKLLDEPNFIPLIEISHYEETSFDEGFNDGVRVLTAFGNVANREHYLSRVIGLTEIEYFYMRANGRKDNLGMQAKNVCDRGAFSQYSDGSRPDGLPKRSMKHYLTRSQALQSTLMTFMSGAYHLNIWDSTLVDAHSLDSYNGIIAALAVLNYKKDFGSGVVKSATDLRPNAEFELWETEVSYDGGTTWVKQKGLDYQSSASNLPVRVARVADKLIVCACRAYNVEPTACKVRYNKNGFNFVHDITSADFKSCEPNSTRKDYYFNILKMV